MPLNPHANACGLHQTLLDEARRAVKAVRLSRDVPRTGLITQLGCYCSCYAAILVIRPHVIT